jgi:hypothetical protein
MEAAHCPFCGRGSLFWREEQKQSEENKRLLYRVGCPMCRVSMTEPGPWNMKQLDDHPSDDIAIQVLMMRWNIRTNEPLPPPPHGEDPDPALTRTNSDPSTHLN